MATIQQGQQKWLLRKFHTLCTRNGMSTDQKLALIGSYGVISSKDMTNRQLFEACELLESAINPEAEKLSKTRKRVMAAIGGWLSLIGKEADAEYIKTIACRAAGVENFNRISLGRLTNLYNMFCKKQKDARQVNAVCGRIAYEVRFGNDNTTNPN